MRLKNPIYINILNSKYFGMEINSFKIEKKKKIHIEMNIEENL